MASSYDSDPDHGTKKKRQKTARHGTTGTTDSLSIIFSFLHWKDILGARVCRKWCEAVRVTQVPLTYGWLGLRCFDNTIPDFYIKKSKVLTWMPKALPRMSGVALDFSMRYDDPVFQIAPGEDATGRGQDRDEVTWFSEEIIDLHDTLTKFRDLRHLELIRVNLDGRYPYLFQSFPQLEILDVSSNPNFLWNLEDLSGFPNLKKLRANKNNSLTGSLSSVRLFCKEKLVELCLLGCENITGSIHDLADFPVLEKLDVSETSINGDILNLSPEDFISIKTFEMGEAVYGGKVFDRVLDAPLLMQALYHMKKRSPELFKFRRWCLSKDSPDHYNFSQGYFRHRPPFWIEFVVAGLRIGWRWTCNPYNGGSCEAIWFDPEPQPSSEGYDKYLRKLSRIENDVTCYRGYTSPPTAQQHAEMFP